MKGDEEAQNEEEEMLFSTPMQSHVRNNGKKKTTHKARSCKIGWLLRQ